MTEYAFDAELADGTGVSHSLLVTLLVTSELATEDRSRLEQPIGVCRHLRMRFNVILTNYSGASVSWDNELPPNYGDDAARPPEYFIGANQFA